jgi:hypothetical protein
MNALASVAFARPTYRSSTEQLIEPFPQEMYEVFVRLEMLASEHGEAVGGPRAATFDWAKEVLLRVLPRKFLIGADISTFEREIHATWESEEKGKRVVVFFPAPNELKIYHELVQGNAVTEHRLVSTNSAADISERLRWFCQ